MKMGTNSVEQDTAVNTDVKDATSTSGQTKPKQNASKETLGPNEQGEQPKKQRKKKYRSRKFPIPLRILVVLVLLIISGLLGLVVGYGFFGDGEPLDALKIETYQHIIDIVKTEK